MRLAIDARELGGLPTGVGRYLLRLLECWAVGDAASRHELLCYLPAPPSQTAKEVLARLGAGIRVLPGNGGTRWEQWDFARALRADRPDVCFAPAYTGPLLSAAPLVVTIHDLSYMARHEWFHPRERWRRAILTRLTADRATAVITDSVFSRDEVRRLLGVPTERITVIPLGLGLAPAGDPAVRREPLVLYVGSLFNRRRIADTIRAFAQVARVLPDAVLEIVGENRTWPHEDYEIVARDAGVAGRVRIRSWIPDSDLRDLYNRAGAFVFLSEYEGFGLTPLEALCHQVPAVVLDTAVSREVCGPAGLYVPVGRIDETAAMLLAALTDVQVRRRVLDAATAWLPRYSWTVAAAHTLAVLEGAGEHGPCRR